MIAQDNKFLAPSVRANAEGLIISIRVTPRANRDAIVGIELGAEGAGHLAARVRTVPEGGKANAAVAALIADWLDLPKSACSVIAGGKSRLKQVQVRGDPVRLAERLKSLLEKLGPGEQS